MLKYFIIPILTFVSPIFSEDLVEKDEKEETIELVVEETEETTFFRLNAMNLFTNPNDVDDYNILGGAIPSYTITSNPGKMKIGFGISNKEYNNYYHSDGTSLGIDYLDCGTDGQCSTIYQDVASDGNDILFTAPVESIANPNWTGPDTNGSEGDGINGSNVYTSNGITFSAMYHGMDGVGFDFYLLQENRNYTFLADIIDRGLVEHPLYDNALAVDPTQDWTHYDFGVYYVWNEIENMDYPLFNSSQYTLPTTRILSGLYFSLSYGSKYYTTPFNIYLRDFQLERYPGSSSPSSYAAEVTVLDNGADFPYRIYMNNVLQYKGFRFFQSSYDKDEKGTILSVNHDWWGTLITYIGYSFL